MLKALQKFFGPKPLDYVTFEEGGVTYKVKVPEIIEINDYPAIRFEFACQLCWIKDVIVWLEPDGKDGFRVKMDTPFKDAMFYQVFNGMGHIPPTQGLLNTINIIVNDVD